MFSHELRCIGDPCAQILRTTSDIMAQGLVIDKESLGDHRVTFIVLCILVKARYAMVNGSFMSSIKSSTYNASRD